MATPLQEKIKAYLEAERLSLAAFERKAGLKINVVRNIMRGQSKSPTSDTLQAIARVLGCTLNALLGAEATAQTPAQSQKVDYPLLLEESLRLLHAKTQTPLSLGETFRLMEKIYTYTLRKTPPLVDPDFVDWVLEER